MFAYLFFVVFLSVSVNGRVLPYCTKTQIPDLLVEEGVIHIIYTMKNKCVQCYTIALLLPILKEQLEIDEGIEVKLIVGVDSGEEGESHPLRILPNAIIDTSGEIYKKLGNNNGFLFIIDRCRRLTYRIVPEHASKFRPYVWATILSTSISNPCGYCTFSFEEGEKQKSQIKSPSEEPVDDNFWKKLIFGKDTETNVEVEGKHKNFFLDFILFIYSLFDTKKLDLEAMESEPSEETSEEKERLKEHYSKLIPWIYIASQ